MNKKLLVSSVNPNEVALTVKGAILSFLPFVVMLVKFYGVDVEESTLTDIAEATGDVIIAIGSAVSVGAVLWGLIRKLLVSLGFYK